MRYKLVIFDFDGTLADSLPWMVTILDQVADKFHVKRVDPNDLEELRGYSARQLFQLYEIPFWKLALMGSYVRRQMGENINQIQLFPGVDRLLERLDERGIPLALVTSNSFENACQVLGPANAARFRYLECGVSLFGKSPKLQKILRKSKVAPGDAICIGDEIRDIEAAKKIKIPFGAVSWGYTRLTALQAHGPEEVFSSVEDMFEKLTADFSHGLNGQN